MVFRVDNFKALRITSIAGLAKVVVDSRDANSVVYLAHSEEELMQPSGTGQINGTRITAANSPSAVDWTGELWVRADQDGRNVDLRVQKPAGQ